MEVKQCPNGHIYPSSEKVCPQCVREGKISQGSMGTPDFGEMEEYSKTEAVNMDAFFKSGDGGWNNGGTALYDDNSKTQPGAFSNGYEPNPFSSQKVEDYDGATIVGPGYQSSSGLRPVVGWLVCVNGPCRGMDFRIHSDNNYIGRNPSNDICIPNQDMRISRDKHAILGFDSESGTFFFGPFNGRNIVKVNNKPIFSAMEIHNRDILTIGASSFLFVALCGEGFRWED